MASTVSAVQPEAILKELGKLWASLGKQENAEKSVAVLRACSMTLVVVSTDPQDGPLVGETLAALMHEHPSRAIVVRLGDEEKASLEARVLAQCWMPFGSRQQICCEHIEITANQSGAVAVPTAVLGLTVPDLPVVFWCRHLAAVDSPALHQLLPLADKVILDTGGVPDPAGAFAQVRSLRQDSRGVADLAWTRVTHWRETVAQSFDDPSQLARLGGVQRASISGHSTSAYYLGGWLRSVLGPSLPIEFSPAEEAIRDLSLHGQELELKVSVAGGCTIDVTTGARQCRTVFPEANEYELVREELAILGHDPAFDAALPLAAELAARQG